MNYRKIRRRLANKKGLGLYEPDEIKYLEKPLGKAAYLGEKIEETIDQSDEDKLVEEISLSPLVKVKALWSDRVKCPICGKRFTRSCRNSHEKTSYHKTYLKFHKKLRKIMLDDDDINDQ